MPLIDVRPRPGSDPPLYCPKCGESFSIATWDSISGRMSEELYCEPGEMGLADRLREIFEARYLRGEPQDPHPTYNAQLHGHLRCWFCPGCGVHLDEHGACPRCHYHQRDVSYHLVEIHPHRDVHGRDPTIPSIEPPIFLTFDDFAVFLSVPEAEAYIEPADAEETVLYDATGRALLAIPDEQRRRVHLVADDWEPAHQDDLAQAVRRHLRTLSPKSWLRRSGTLERLSITEQWLDAATLEELVAKVVEVEKAWRNRSTLLRRMRGLLRR